MEDLVDRGSGNHEPPAEPDRGYLTAAHEVVGEPSGDAEESSGAFNADRQRLGVLLGVHVR